MNREDIIRMAREAQMPFYWRTGEITYLDKLERFAALVVSAEREACAEIVDNLPRMNGKTWGDAIRARGNVDTNDTSQKRVDKTSESVHKPMHPQLKAMLEEYFDKCFAESAPQRTWVGLTDEEIDTLRLATGYAAGLERFTVIARAIEAKLKEKNT